MLRHLKQINERLGRAVSRLMVAMVFATFAVVVLRYVFNYGRVDIQEVTTYLHVIILTLCMGYTMKHDEHVRVDIFYQGFGERRRTWINLVGHWLFLIPVCLAILIASWDYAFISWQVLEKSAETGGLPFVFVIKSLPLAMALLLIIHGISDSVRCLLKLRDMKK